MPTFTNGDFARIATETFCGGGVFVLLSAETIASDLKQMANARMLSHNRQETRRINLCGTHITLLPEAASPTEIADLKILISNPITALFSRHRDLVGKSLLGNS
ncbi:hypothetical protein [Rubripirellula reticaptiva]|uniref:hypothetical protein n=1 Tax=Rubripirellula reticaptiva TaxID=2528013 RepID=UPI0011B399F5|nr:hypothetical protein [Rubripirellula reticaptiva]